MLFLSLSYSITDKRYRYNYGTISLGSVLAKREILTALGCLRLGVQRLRTLQEKKGAQAKAARRDIAVLLEKGKLETARIKVENSAWHELVLLISPADT